MDGVNSDNEVVMGMLLRWSSIHTGQTYTSVKCMFSGEEYEREGVSQGDTMIHASVDVMPRTSSLADLGREYAQVGRRQSEPAPTPAQQAAVSSAATSGW